MKTFSRAVSRTFVAITVAGLGLALTPQAAWADVFTVDASAYSDSANTLFDADAIHGEYDEILTVTSFDPITGFGTFETVATWDAGNWVLGGTNVVQTGLNEDYGVYALFEATGEFQVGATATEFVATGGSIELWLDQFNPVTSKTLPATGTGGLGSIGIAGAGDPDILLATSDLASGDGSFSPGQAAGDFGLTFNPFSLTSEGSDFFIEPEPFYLTAILQGNFNTFNPNIENQVILGSANAAFEGLQEVPEPTSLTLLGLGLLGSGYMVRRRRKV